MTHTTTRSAMVALLTLLFGGLSLTGCNTVKGAGQDIEAAGDAVSDTADETQDSL